jgi:hypothetical protein
VHRQQAGDQVAAELLAAAVRVVKEEVNDVWRLHGEEPADGFNDDARYKVWRNESVHAVIRFPYCGH